MRNSNQITHWKTGVPGEVLYLSRTLAFTAPVGNGGTFSRLCEPLVETSGQLGCSGRKVYCRKETGM